MIHTVSIQFSFLCRWGKVWWFGRGVITYEGLNSYGPTLIKIKGEDKKWQILYKGWTWWYESQLQVIQDTAQQGRQKEIIWNSKHMKMTNIPVYK